MTYRDYQPTNINEGLIKATQQEWGTTRAGDQINAFTLHNADGITLSVIEYGATVTRLFMPDKRGLIKNIVLGYGSLDSYEDCPFYVGAIVGRYAGRIRDAEICDGEHRIRLDANAGNNHIHGGFSGFHKKVWSGNLIDKDGLPAIRMRCISPNGEAGFPGTVNVDVVFSLSPDDKLTIDYSATSDAHTYINLTHHGYFNLSGDPKQTIGDHILHIDSSCVLELDDQNIPTGNIQTSDGGLLDYQRPRRVACQNLEAHNLSKDGVIDHDFIVTPRRDGSTRYVGQIHHTPSGRSVSVHTDQPSLHVYTGANLGKRETCGFSPFTGVCLEAQSWPNAPNNPHFPSTVLAPRATYRQKTIYSFGVV